MSLYPPHPKPTGSAFTLIELLVVVAIISVLASMLLPVLSTAREKARSTACIGNLKQFTLAIDMYCDDSDEVYPILGYDGSPQASDLDWMRLKPSYIDGQGYEGWVSALYRYSGAGIYSCPSAEIRKAGWSYAWARYSWASVDEDGRLDMGTASGTSPHINKRGRERYRKRKILMSDGNAGWRDGNPWQRRTVIQANYFTAAPHNLSTNVILLENRQVTSLPLSHPALNDPAQTWWDTDKRSAGWAY